MLARVAGVASGPEGDEAVAPVEDELASDEVVVLEEVDSEEDSVAELDAVDVELDVADEEVEDDDTGGRIEYIST